jgi:hypothetical protein
MEEDQVSDLTIVLFDHDDVAVAEDSQLRQVQQGAIVTDVVAKDLLVFDRPLEGRDRDYLGLVRCARAPRHRRANDARRAMASSAAVVAGSGPWR